MNETSAKSCKQCPHWLNKKTKCSLMSKKQMNGTCSKRGKKETNKKQKKIGQTLEKLNIILLKKKKWTTMIVIVT